MTDQFFEQPILNSPYEYPARHWALEDGQPTNQIIPKRRRADFKTPSVPKLKKRRQGVQKELILYGEDGLSTDAQQYDPNPIINSTREQVEAWRRLPNPEMWRVTPETLAKSSVSSHSLFFLPSGGSRNGDLASRGCAKVRKGWTAVS